MGQEMSKGPNNQMQVPKSSNIPVLKQTKVPTLTPAMNKTILKIGVFKRKKKLNCEGQYSSALQLGSTGLIYCGEWKNYRPFGFGTLYFPDKSIYQGYVKDNKPNVQGRFIMSNGVYYEGQILDGQASGYGILCNEYKQLKYKGNWIHDLPHGKGSQQWGDKAVFKGNFNQGIKQGTGTYIKSNEYTYHGNFKNNLFDGYGSLFVSNGDVYNGNWQEGNYHGEGEYKWANKEYYKGQYEEGFKEGRGCYISATEGSYDGLWEKGQKQGLGIIQNGSKNVREVWRKSKKSHTQSSNSRTIAN